MRAIADHVRPETEKDRRLAYAKALAVEVADLSEVLLPSYPDSSLPYAAAFICGKNKLDPSEYIEKLETLASDVISARATGRLTAERLNSGALDGAAS